MIRFQISDLLSHPGSSRTESAVEPVSARLPNASVDDDAEVSMTLRSMSDGIIVRGRVRTAVDLTCTRCLTEWTAGIEVPLEAVFRLEPDDADDELPIESGGWIDLDSVVHDEVSLALPSRPLCREDCRGLCPTCGTDLNIDPCDGHGEQQDSPFAVLQQLFSSETSPPEH
jgi:uncharacterized protein